MELYICVATKLEFSFSALPHDAVELASPSGISQACQRNYFFPKVFFLSAMEPCFFMHAKVRIFLAIREPTAAGSSTIFCPCNV